MEYHRRPSVERDSGRNIGQEDCYHRYFESQVRKRPDAVAVIAGNEQATYAGLNCRANLLAYQLINAGIGPEIPVGVFVDRSIELVTAAVAIAKAGGVIVPLDPEHPGSYLDGILEETGLQVVVKRASNPTVFSKENLKYIDIDCWGDLDSDRAFQNPSVSMSIDNTCGIFFTSGSTGRPKGVMITYRSSLSRFNLTIELGLLAEKQRHLVQAPVSVAPLIGKIFYSLSTGGGLVLAKPGGERDGVYLLELLKSHQVNTITCSPTLLQDLLREDESIRDTNVRCIITSGERVPASLQNRLQSLGDIDLYKFYGLTEAATVSYCKYRHDQNPGTVGYPAYSRVYVLNEQMRMVSQGVVGDIYVSGDGLARGYLNRSALTAARFIANRFEGNGGRLFKTGDRGRWHRDGTLEVVGRSDEQVKVRGFRVEVGEVESVLGQYPGMESVVVMVDTSGKRSRRLVAYVVTETMATIGPDDLRQFLHNRLPGYMVPDIFIFLEKMPVLGNGKIDRNRLSNSTIRARSADVRTVQAPETPAEHALGLIWSEVLEVSQISVDNNFFSLGGSSLDLTRVVSRIRDTLGITLPFDKVIRRPTLRNMAEILSEELAQLSDEQICVLLAEEDGKDTHQN